MGTSVKLRQSNALPAPKPSGAVGRSFLLQDNCEQRAIRDRLYNTAAAKIFPRTDSSIAAPIAWRREDPIRARLAHAWSRVRLSPWGI
jgi:hypothetical protein